MWHESMSLYVLREVYRSDSGNMVIVTENAIPRSDICELLGGTIEEDEDGGSRIYNITKLNNFIYYKMGQGIFIENS